MVRSKALLERHELVGEGVYCFYPFDNLDDKDSGIFKIGMTESFDNRIKSYHTYLPKGLYYKAFLINPTLHKEGARNNKVYYTRIEREIFEDIRTQGGVPVTIEIRKRNEGETEWIYCSDKMVEGAFERAYKYFGGKRSGLKIIDNFPLELKTRRHDLERRKIFKGEIYYDR